MSNIREQVTVFHAAIGQNDPTVPAVPCDEIVRLRARLVAEEFFETMRALLGALHTLDAAEHDIMMVLSLTNPLRSVDLVAFADGCADLAYVVEGSMLAFGIDSGPVAAEVHRTNMAKLDGPVRADGKRLKPLGWTPPDIKGCLKAQGWKP